MSFASFTKKVSNLELNAISHDINKSINDPLVADVITITEKSTDVDTVVSVVKEYRTVKSDNIILWIQISQNHFLLKRKVK